jgi:hypothetical protein
LPLLILVIVVMALAASGARGEVFHSKESALRMAFPDADSITTRTLLLDDEQAERIESMSRTKLNSRLVKVYEGQRGDSIVGHAFIETHRVRSLPETLLVVVDAAGNNRGVNLLAFHEPQNYAPTQRWLGQFDDRRLDEELALNHGIATIAGSTLTSQAITASVRRIMAIHRVAVSSAEGLATARNDSSSGR